MDTDTRRPARTPATCVESSHRAAGFYQKPQVVIGRCSDGMQGPLLLDVGGQPCGRAAACNAVSRDCDRYPRVLVSGAFP